MEQNYLEVANKPAFWIIAITMVAVVISQAVIFMRKAFKTSGNIGITEDQIKTTIRASIITSIGPSFAILIGLVALISLIGSPMAYMRLGVIGAVMFETLCVDAGAEAVGVMANTPEFDLYAFSNVLWVMCVASIGWLLITAFLTPKLETVRLKLVGGKDYLLLNYILPSVFGGVFGSFAIRNIKLGIISLVFCVILAAINIINANIIAPLAVVFTIYIGIKMTEREYSKE